MCPCCNAAESLPWDSQNLKVSSVDSLKKTLSAYMDSFEQLNIWDRVKAIVVQPGVEFGNDAIVTYNSEDFQELKKFINSL